MDFEDRLFRTVHFQANVDQLLRPLQVRINDKLRKENPQAIGLLDEGAGLAAKFIFLETHFSRYVEIFYEEIHDLGNDYFFLYDLYQEGRLEILHSVIAARIGMTNQGINILRRSYECAILGAFLSISSCFNDEKIKINPFVELVGVWPYITGNSVTRRDLENIKDMISKSNHVSKRDAEHLLLTNFTKHYLLYLCKPSCHEHFDDEKSIVVHAPPGLKPGRHRVYTPTDLQTSKCRCSAAADRIIANKPVPSWLMIKILLSKLGNHNDMNSLYRELSLFLHPNPAGHQHTPEYETKDLKKWVFFMKETLNIMIWLYVKCLKYLGYDEKATTNLIESKKYDLDKCTLNDLIKGVCDKIGEWELRYHTKH